MDNNANKTMRREPTGPRRGRSSRLAAALLAAFAATAAAAHAEPGGVSVYVEAGRSADNSGHTSSTLGLRIPTSRTFWDGRVSLAWDLYVADWRTDAPAGYRSRLTEVGVVPMFRYRWDHGQSPWFMEGGIGLSYLDGVYHAHSDGGDFSTRLNFSDHLGVGRNFGTQRQHELGVYVKHVSNAGLRKPNPGETYLQLRYAYRF